MPTSNNNETETTLDDVLGAVNKFATDVEQNFKGVEQNFKGVEQKFKGIDANFIDIKQRLSKVESQMVTKEYLDDKMSSLKGDLTILMRKEDTKLKALVELLEQKKIISPDDKKHILSLEPFPLPAF